MIWWTCYKLFHLVFLVCQTNTIKSLFDSVFRECYRRFGIQLIILFFHMVWHMKGEHLQTAKCPEFCCKSWLSQVQENLNTQHWEGLKIVFLSVVRWQNYTVGTLTFKCVKGLEPRYLFSHFVTKATAHNQNTRKKNKIIRYLRAQNLICCWAVIVSLQISNYVKLITHCYHWL